MTVDPERGQDAEFLFGELAVRLFMITRRDLDQVLKAQAEAREAGGNPSLGEVCEGLELLSAEQVQAVLRAQKIYDPKSVETLYGRLAVKNRFVSQENLEAALVIQERTGRRLRVGEVLVKKSMITWEQHESILRAQERILRGIEESRAMTRSHLRTPKAD